jgi:Bacterial capsule synthesis protein PGA_cap
MALRRPGDLVVVSIHWGSNWGYHIPDEQKILARLSSTRQACRSFTGILRIIRERSKFIEIDSFSMAAVIF